MKRLIVFRHAKSDWGASNEGDHARPLNPRGRRAARLMGAFLARADQVPELVLTSSARRAQDTVALAVEAGGWKCAVDVTDALYATSVESALDVLRGQDDGVESLLIAGHEPTWSELAGVLVGAAHVRFPTAAMARIDLATEQWGDLSPGAGELVWHVTPRLLAHLGFEA